MLSRLDVFNYTRRLFYKHFRPCNKANNLAVNFVPYFAWAGAEIAVAMICVGVPTLRPLYLKSRGLPNTHSQQSRSHNNELPQFTMMKEKPSISSPIQSPSVASPSQMEAGLAMPGKAYLKKTSMDGSSMSSDAMAGPERKGEGGVRIWVKNEIRIQEDDAEWPLTRSSR